jgi:ABC-2 type transport system ATP-binding protein
MGFIKKLAKEKNMAILVSSHILSDLELLADDCILLRNGKVYLSGDISGFRTEKQKITFGFENKPDETILDRIAPGKFTSSAPWYWETSLTTTETTEAVKTLVSMGLIPFEIQRADLLNTKYMEII